MDNLEQINKYLDKLLPDTENAAFEDRLQNSLELQEELKVAKATRAAMEIWQIESLKDQFETYAKKKPNFELRRKAIYRVGYAAAAVIILLLVGLWVTSPREKTIDNKLDWLAENFSVYDTNKSSDSKTKVAFADTILAFYKVYNAGDEEALSVKLQELEQFIEGDPNTFTSPRKKALAIYMGAGYYKLKKYVKARAYFEHAKLSRHSDIAEEILNAPFWKEQGL